MKQSKGVRPELLRCGGLRWHARHLRSRQGYQGHRQWRGPGECHEGPESSRARAARSTSMPRPATSCRTSTSGVWSGSTASSTTWSSMCSRTSRTLPRRASDAPLTCRADYPLRRHRLRHAVVHPRRRSGGDHGPDELHQPGPWCIRDGGRLHHGVADAACRGALPGLSADRVRGGRRCWARSWRARCTGACMPSRTWTRSCSRSA